MSFEHLPRHADDALLDHLPRVVGKVHLADGGLRHPGQVQAHVLDGPGPGFHALLDVGGVFFRRVLDDGRKEASEALTIAEDGTNFRGGGVGHRLYIGASRFLSRTERGVRRVAPVVSHSVHLQSPRAIGQDSLCVHSP